MLLYGLASLLVISCYWIVQHIAPLQTAAAVLTLLICACYCCPQEVTLHVLALL